MDSDVADVEGSRLAVDESGNAVVGGSVGMGVGLGYAYYCSVKHQGKLFGVVSAEKLNASLFVVSHHKPVKYHVSHILGQHFVLEVLVDSKIRVDRRNGRVLAPRIVRIAVISDLHAGVHPRLKHEDSQTETSVGVSHVVGDVAEGVAHRTHIKSSGRTVRFRFDFVPKSVEIAAGRVVVHHIVARISYPERCH